MMNWKPLILLLCFSLTACTYIPLGGTKSCVSPNREQSKEDGFYICEYRPLNDIFYYSDSLITIRIKILDAYAEECHAEKRRFPPYIKKHYYLDTNSLYLIFHYILDSSTTKTFCDFSDHKNDWWRLKMNTHITSEMCEEFYSEQIHKMGIRYQDLISFGNLSSVDTLYLPVVFGAAYNDTVWPNYKNREWVLIGKIAFIMEELKHKDLKKIKDRYREKREEILGFNYPLWYNSLKTANEMDSIYGR